MKIITIIVLGALLSSCASTTPGEALSLNSHSLSATYVEKSDFSTDTIKMYQFSFKNLTDKWVSIDEATIDNKTDSVEILLGKKIEAWMEATTLEKNVSAYNMSLALGSLALAGAVVGATAKSSGTSNVGLAVSVGAISATGVREMMESKNKAEFQAILPDGHLFRPFVIPPKKVIQRWILIENPKRDDLHFVMTSSEKEKMTFGILKPVETPPVECVKPTNNFNPSYHPCE